MSNMTRVRAIPLALFDLNDADLLFWHYVATLEESCFCVRFTNAGDHVVFICYEDIDGTASDADDAHDVILPEQTLTLYFQANASYSSKNSSMAKGTPICLASEANDNEFYVSGYTFVE